MSLGDVLAKIHSDVERVGWSVIGVFGTADDPSLPFSYSIGFQEYEHPELLVVGLEPTMAHQIIGGLYERVKAGERFTDGQHDSGVLEGYDVVFRELPPDGRPLNMARNYYGTDELPALQVVWPDPQGWFPGDDECDPKYANAQDLAAIREEEVS